MNTLFKNFLQDEQGQDLVEYSLLLAFIALVGVSALKPISKSITNIFDHVQKGLDKAPTK